MNQFTSHELKLIFTSVRRYQKNMVNNPYYDKEYTELGEILTKLQPIAYAESYHENNTNNR